MGYRFESEFRRVFGSINMYDGYFADGWPEPVKYDEDKAVDVLARFGDGHGATEKGDAAIEPPSRGAGCLEVCAALEVAGAVIG